MEEIIKDATQIKEWLEHIGFEYEHPGYGKDVYAKLNNIIQIAQSNKSYD